MSEISDKIIAKIENEKITPVPKWRFLLRDYVIWAIGAFSVLLGSLAVAIIIFLLTDQDWGVYRMTERHLWLSALGIIPYFWIVVLLIFCSVAYYHVRHTERGYRYHSYVVVLASVCLSFLFGIIIYGAGIGEKADDMLYTRVGTYRRMIVHRDDLWQQPEQGRLAGKILSVEKEEEFVLLAFGGETWLVNVKEARVMPMIKIAVGEIVAVVGEKTGDRLFTAKEVRPWMGRAPGERPFMFGSRSSERIMMRRAY